MRIDRGIIYSRIRKGGCKLSQSRRYFKNIIYFFQPIRLRLQTATQDAGEARILVNAREITQPLQHTYKHVLRPMNPI